MKPAIHGARANAAAPPKRPDPALQPGRAASFDPPPPEREIPAVVNTMRERLELLLRTADHLRDRLGPTLRVSDPSPSGLCEPVSMTELGSEIQLSIRLANDVANILDDIHSRLEL
jgi:hypothetical protein